MANIGSLVADLRLQSAAFIRDMTSAARNVETNTAKMRRSMRQVEQASRQVSRSFAQLRTGAAALAGALAVRQFATFARSALNSASAIQDVANKVGLTTDELQQMRFAAEQTGVKITALDMGMQRFSRRLGEVAQGQGELLKTAKQYEVQLRDSEGRMRSNIDVLKDFADVIKNAESNQERLRIAFKLFDSEGAALVNTLRDGRVGLEAFMNQAIAFGAVMDKEVIARAKLAGDSLSALQRVFSVGFDTSIIKGFAGSIAITEDNLRAAREAGEQFGRLVGQAMRGVVTAAKFVADNMLEIKAAIAGVIALKATLIFGGIAAALAKLAKEALAAASATKALTAAMAKNPFGLAAIAIASGVAALILWQNETVKIGDTSFKVGDILTKIWNTVKASIQNTVDVVKNLSKAIGQFLSGNFEKAWKSLGEVTKTQIATLKKVRDIWTKTKPAVTDAKTVVDQFKNTIKNLGNATGTTTDQVKTYLENLRHSTMAALDLAAATEMSAAAAREMANRQEEENAVKSAGIDITKKLTKANKQAAEEIRQLIRLRRAATRAIEQQKRLVESRDRLTILKEEEKLIGATAVARAKSVAILEKELELKRKGIDLTTEAARQEVELAGEIAETTAKLEEAKKARELFLEPFKNAIRGIQDSFTDMFQAVFSGGVDSFKDLSTRIKDIFVRLAAEIATLMVFRPIVQGLVNASGQGNFFGGAGGIGGGASSSGGQSVASVGGSIFSKIFGGGQGQPTREQIAQRDIANNPEIFGTSRGSGFGFINNGRGVGPVSQGGIVAGASVLATSLNSDNRAPISTSLAPIAAMFGPYGMIAAAIMTLKGFTAGRSPTSPLGVVDTLTGPSIDEIINDPKRAGFEAASFIGPLGPIGTVISDFIGPKNPINLAFNPIGFAFANVFGTGKKKSVGPGGGADLGIDPATGRASFRSSGGDNGFNPTGLAETIKDIVGVINQTVEAIGGDFTTGTIASLQSIGGGIYSNVSVGPETGNLGTNIGAVGFGGDVDAAINDLLIRVFKRVPISGIADEVQTVIANSTAATFEDFVSDLDFGMMIAGITTNLSAFERAMRDIDIRFDSMIERALSLGLSIDQLNAARERERAAVELQARSPFLAAAESIAGFLRGAEVQFASPADQIRITQGQFADLLGQVRGGDIGATGQLLQSAQSLIGFGRGHFASTVDFQNIDRFVRSSLASVGETLISEEFFDAQVVATQQQTEVLSDDLASIREAIDGLRDEFRLTRRQLEEAA